MTTEETETTILGEAIDASAPADISGQVGDNTTDVEQFIAANVGEGKQYATIEDAVKGLAKSKLHADTFIETLKLEKRAVETEKEELAKKLQSAKTMDDVLAAIQSGGDTPPRDENGETLSKDAVAKLVSEALANKEKENKTQAELAKIKENQQKAWELMAKGETEGGFGSLESAKELIRKYIGNDKTRADIVNRLGGYDPQGLVTFLKANKPAANSQDTHTQSKLVTGETSANSGKLTWSEAQRIKKEKPKYYRSREFQLRLHKAASENPDFLNT